MSTITRVIAQTTSQDSTEISDLFKAAFRLHPSGVAVITGVVDGVPAAMTISSLISLSMDPPLLLFSLSKFSYATKQLMQTDSIIVHFLGAESRWLAELGAQGHADRFADPKHWTSLPSGEPQYYGVNAWLKVRIVDRTEAGSSIVCIGEVVEGEASDLDHDQTPLVYHARTWHGLGQSSTLA